MNELVVAFTVYGQPQQRGSKTPWIPRRKDGSMVTKDGRPVIATMDSNKNSKAWMAAISAAAGEHYQGMPLIEGPVIFTARFYFHRPKSHFGTGKNTGVLKSTAPLHHTQTPDLAKLIRCAEDGITKVIWADDKQVFQYGESTGKYWTSNASRADFDIRLA